MGFFHSYVELMLEGIHQFSVQMTHDTLVLSIIHDFILWIWQIFDENSFVEFKTLPQINGVGSESDEERIKYKWNREGLLDLMRCQNITTYISDV